MSDEPTPTRFRVRWGWFVGCIVFGMTAIVVGLLVAPPGSRLSYVSGVLANIGTTLLLVGIVLLLERRIIDNAVRVVRTASQQTNEALRVQIQDLEDRLATTWAGATVDTVAEKKAETTRLTDEFTKRVVDDATGED